MSHQCVSNGKEIRGGVVIEKKEKYMEGRNGKVDEVVA
jgi:hypothetical protein